MKIASLETGIVLLPNDEPLAGFSENPNAKNPIVWLRLRTDDGIEGLGVAYFGGALTRTLRHAVDELGALTIGEDPLRVEAIAAKLRAAAGSSGPAGILMMAMSAIDVALWDIKGKALGLPLWKLLGGGRDRIATYASGAGRRGIGDARRRRRIPLWHHPVPPHAGGALGRYRDDRPGALGRHHAVAQDRRHGGSLQPPGRQPRRAGDSCASGRRGAERPDRRVHAAAVSAVARRAAAGRWHARNAHRTRSRPRIRRRGDREIPGMTMSGPPNEPDSGHPAAGLHTELHGRL